MRIKKTYRSAVKDAKVLNERSTSQDNTYSCDYVNNLNTYSTEEQIVGKWADGKPIYRKVLYYTNLARGYNQKTHDISGFDKLIKVYGTWNDNTDGQQPFPCNVPDGNPAYGLGIGNFNATRFGIIVGTSRATTNNLYLILEYTKTTD